MYILYCIWTQWEVFGSVDINEHVEIVTDYINSCVGTVIPTKIFAVYPNDKPWVSKELKILTNKKGKSYKKTGCGNSEVHTEAD